MQEWVQSPGDGGQGGVNGVCIPGMMSQPKANGDVWGLLQADVYSLSLFPAEAGSTCRASEEVPVSEHMLDFCGDVPRCEHTGKQGFLQRYLCGCPNLMSEIQTIPGERALF